jgi:uridine kinase
MRIALLIAGYLRSYKTNIDFIKEEIINKYDNVDVYLHITKDEKLEDRYFNQIEERDIKAIINDLKPISTIIENNTHYSKDETTNNIINHWGKLYKLNNLKKIKENATNKKYDLVIRYRLDLSIVSKNIFDISYVSNTIFIPKDSKIDKVKLTNKTDGYLCDALAFGDSNSMDKYFDIYTELNMLIKNYGSVSETILFNYLTKNKINYELIHIDYSFILSKCNVFAICGDSGSGKSTLSALLKNIFSNSFILECDRYHKWERTNKNWEEVTHLNPNANYITKMNEDVFNLKIGKDIYQVDYNHHNGKFTKKQLINPSDNLIVCGLHSLYTNNNSVYDLKIYMDTDEDLKKKWKINRDVRERGYSVQKVLDSIQKRENDFKEFILPQRDNADLVVRFFTTEEIYFNDLEHQNKLSLELSINKNFNVGKLVLNLNKLNIPLIVDYEDKFIKIQILEYVEVDLGFNTKSFYDYILYFILNL